MRERTRPRKDISTYNFTTNLHLLLLLLPPTPSSPQTFPECGTQQKARERDKSVETACNNFECAAALFSFYTHTHTHKKREKLIIYSCVFTEKGMK
jgi:hypothetical protein